MNKIEKVLWGLGIGLASAATFIIQQKEALSFLHLPTWIFDGATLVGLIARNIQLQLNKKG